MRHLIKSIRPLPYWNCQTLHSDRVLAQALRSDFVGKVSRSLPLHFLKGFKGGEIVNAVSRLKKRVQIQPKPPKCLQVAGRGAMESRLTEALEKLNAQLTQIIAQQRKQTRLLTQLLQTW